MKKETKIITVKLPNEEKTITIPKFGKIVLTAHDSKIVKVSVTNDELIKSNDQHNRSY